MPDGNDCPECGENVGIQAVFKAPVLNRIRCPHCRARLHYVGTGWMIVVVAVLAILLVLAAGAVSLYVFQVIESVGLSVVIMVVTLVVGGSLIEVVLVRLLWYGDYRLESVNPWSMCDDE